MPELPSVPGDTPAGDVTWHFYQPSETQQPNFGLILCVRMGSVSLDDFINQANAINITVIEADVTCQQCLEWLHA